MYSFAEELLERLWILAVHYPSCQAECIMFELTELHVTQPEDGSLSSIEDYPLKFVILCA